MSAGSITHNSLDAGELGRELAATIGYAIDSTVVVLAGRIIDSDERASVHQCLSDMVDRFAFTLASYE
ncbi:MAG: hypothetical protein ACLPV4_23710 [Solirubrobacteraceae bacterium]